MQKVDHILVHRRLPDVSTTVIHDRYTFKCRRPS